MLLPVRQRILCGISRRLAWRPFVALSLGVFLFLAGSEVAAQGQLPAWNGSKLAPQSRPASPGLQVLLKKFPFGTQRLDTTPTPRTEAAAPSPPPRRVPVRRPSAPLPTAAPATTSEGTTLLWRLAIPTALATILLLILLVVRPERRRQAGLPARARAPTAEVVPLLSVRPVVSGSPAWDKSIPFVDERSVKVSDRPENRDAAKGEEASEDLTAAAAVSEEEFAGVGTHVTSVLRAADAAAAQIRGEAKSHAADIRRKAEAEAQAAAQRLKQDGEQRRTEAETEAGEIRRVAEAYATQHRQEAEQQARHALTDAEGQARATRQAAEEMAKQIESAARERRDVLEGETRKLEVRLHRLLEGVRDLSSQLEGLVGPSGEREGQSDGSLAEVLRVPRRSDPAAS